MEYEKNPKKFFVKDKEIVCPNCGTRNSLRDLIKNGEFDDISFEENSCPEDYNPFDKPQDNGAYNDRISLSYICHCEQCGEYLSPVLVNTVFAVDVYDNNCNVIDTFYTEKIE